MLSAVRFDLRAVIALACAVAGIGVVSTAAQQPQLPTFRAGVRLVEVDVAVRDRDDRFVDTLTKDDFEILEDGTPRQIERLWVVNLPTDGLTNPPATAASPLAVVGSEVDAGRLYVLVLGGGVPDRVRSVARQFITEFLGPTDLMAVAHVSNRANTQGLTSDRELLLASVARYQGGGGAEASLQMLKEVVVNLNASTGRRKSVLFIGPGFSLWSPPFTDASSTIAPLLVEEGVAALKMTRVFDDVTRTAARNNVRIYPISPEEPQYRTLAGGGQDGDEATSLRILAADTHGIAIANTNNYRGNFPKIVRDNSEYYLLTYNSDAEPDGRAHPITVRLRNRPDLSVRQGRQSVTSPPPDVKGQAVRLPRTLSAEARAALAASAPVPSPTIELFTAVFQAPDYQGSILIGTHVPGALLRRAAGDVIELSYMAVDRWGAVRAVERRAFTVNMRDESGVRAEQSGLRLLGRLRLPRGQYQIRVAAHQANGMTASAATDVEVPDYADEALTVSDFVVASSHGQSLTTLEEDALLRNALPAQPTPVRRFVRDETLTVFAEIYDNHWIVSQEVGVTMTVAEDGGRVVFRGEEVLTSANRGRFYLRGTLGLGSFEPGNYQLLVEAYTRKGIPANSSRLMRFSVLDEPASPVLPGAVLSAVQERQGFDVVSVRRSSTVSDVPAAGASATRAGFRVLPDGRFEARGQSLANLARVAFGFDYVDPNRGVVQAADWMWIDRFDVTASVGHPWSTPPSGTTVPAELRTMLRSLLEDRFALRARISTKKVDVTALRLVKEETLGPGLRPSTAECRGPFADAAPDETEPRPRCPFTNVNSEIKAQAVTMTEVAVLIAQHPLFAWKGTIVDQTGIPGLYDFSFSLPRQGQSQRSGEALLRELESQLGLRLQAASVSLPTLIIERARKPHED